MPRALQISGRAVPLASSASASRSLRMICPGECRMRFIRSPPALTGENDSHIDWTSLRGAGHPLHQRLGIVEEILAEEPAQIARIPAGHFVQRPAQVLAEGEHHPAALRAESPPDVDVGL